MTEEAEKKHESYDAAHTMTSFYPLCGHVQCNVGNLGRR